MLTFECITAKGERLSLTSPLKVTICADVNTPADSLEAIFPYAVNEEINSLKVFREGKEIFTGIADEQIVVSDGRVNTKLICRSMGALLVDNEACPSLFNDVSASLLFDRYAKPLGFEKFTGEDRTLRGSFCVNKGTSCWQVLENFCKKVWGSAPVTEGLSIIMNKAEVSKVPLIFSDSKTEKTTGYTAVEHNRLRCKLISCVRVKLRQGDGYSACIKDSEATESGVCRERFLNADTLSGKSLADADKLIYNSRLRSETITLQIPDCLIDAVGADAVVDDSVLGMYEGFYVEGIRYTLSDKGESTRLDLARKGC